MKSYYEHYSHWWMVGRFTKKKCIQKSFKVGYREREFAPEAISGWRWKCFRRATSTFWGRVKTLTIDFIPESGWYSETSWPETENTSVDQPRRRGHSREYKRVYLRAYSAYISFLSSCQTPISPSPSITSGVFMGAWKPCLPPNVRFWIIILEGILSVE